MSYKYDCDFGDIIDKITILNLKLRNPEYILFRTDILSEINTIYNDFPASKLEDKLFISLHTVNSQLWILKDKIYDKITKHQYDKDYIEYTMNFFRIKYMRKQIKSDITQKYTSSQEFEQIPKADIITLETVKKAYSDGNYNFANTTIQPLLSAYNKTCLKNQFIADLHMSYSNITCVLNIKNEHSIQLEEIMNNLKNYTISSEFTVFTHKIYCGVLLQKKQYEKAEKYMDTFYRISNLHTPMTLFKENDVNKTLFIYAIGGIGDTIMLGRIVKELCLTYKNNNIKWLIDFKSVSWIFDTVFKDVVNLKIIYTSQKKNIGDFNYHCSLIRLFSYLNYKTYDSILFNSYLNNITLNTSYKHFGLLDKLTSSKKKAYIFNWHGNAKCSHELNNRRMQLKNAIPLFNRSDINWIITSKDITSDEYRILKNFNNIFILKDEIEDYDNVKAFSDTIVIFKYITGVISTDTSLVHLALTMNIPTYVLLVLGSEWRWCRNCDKTNWYPKATLIRQKKVSNWDNVIKDVLNMI
uniref:Uncharacterized protein n=1 Tax=viral metagenome TaxID=1070528 RepID=A0A6C0B513_9ZZZZ